MDVTNIDDWNAVIERTVSLHGHVDVLVNNAGTTYKNKVRQSSRPLLFLPAGRPGLVDREKS
jgi:NADP-dependent 3-hydroxy acid dehydrogenase YdfG